MKIKIRHPEDLYLAINMEPPPEEYSKTSIVNALRLLMVQKLPEREAEVIKMRFWFPEVPTVQTLRQCAEFLGVSTERTRQIEAHALARLRHPSARRLLSELLKGKDNATKTD